MNDKKTAVYSHGIAVLATLKLTKWAHMIGEEKEIYVPVDQIRWFEPHLSGSMIQFRDGSRQAVFESREQIAAAYETITHARRLDEIENLNSQLDAIRRRLEIIEDCSP